MRSLLASTVFFYTDFSNVSYDGHVTKFEVGNMHTDAYSALSCVDRCRSIRYVITILIPSLSRNLPNLHLQLLIGLSQNSTTHKG